METNVATTLSLIEDLLENAQSERPTEPCFQSQPRADESNAEFVTPMADVVLV